MSGDPHTLSRAIGGEVVQVRGVEQVLAPASGHSALDRSVSILFGQNLPDGFWVTSFGNGDALTERARIRELIARKGDALALPAGQAARARERKPEKSALWLFDEARHPAGTRVEKYLAYRGLTLPPEAAGTALRYHPDVRFDGERVPAMLALVRDISSNERMAVHRTAISWGATNYDVHGKKRMAWGPTTGGAVKLWPETAVRDVLGIGEGIETSLSLRLVPEFGDHPVWALLHAGGVANFPVLAHVRTLWIAVDHDRAGAGEQAARQCSARWTRAGREVFRVKTDELGDLNDLARQRARNVGGTP